MNAQDPRTTDSRQGRVIIDAEGARDVGPTEAAGLIRECLALTYKRFDAASWHALDALASAAPEEAQGPARGAPPHATTLQQKVTEAVRRDRGKFFSHFRSEFEQLFQARREGRPRARTQANAAAPTLALVDEGDLTGQVALKNAVQRMRVASREDGLGFDLRTRIVLREPPGSGEFDNPWGAQLLCDALGNACRGMWGADGVWRPIMEHLVRAFTPELVALRRELDALLQDRDILPVLRVRMRRREGAGGRVAARGDGEGDGASGAAPRALEAPEVPGADDRNLYHQVLAGLMRGAASAPAAMPTPPWTNVAPHAPIGPAAASPLPVGTAPVGADPLDFGDPGGWHAPVVAAPVPPPASGSGEPWQVLARALALIEASSNAMSPAAGGRVRAAATALVDGTSNALPAVADAVAAAGGAPESRATIEILSGILDEVFENPYLPAEIKTVFGRLQIPFLKAALLDARVLSDPRNPVRRFFDALAAASVGLRPEGARDTLFIELADHIASVVRDQFSDSLDVFATARDELETFLDSERAAYNQKLVQALPSLIALDEHAAARARMQTALAVGLAGRTLPPEIRAYLDSEGVARLTAAYLEGGAEGAPLQREMQLVDDLVWSIAPGPGPDTRRRLLQLIPQLVRAVGEGWPTDDASRARRKVFLARLYQLHIEAIKALPDLPAADADSEPVAPPRIALPPAGAIPAPAAAHAGADAVDSLMRGDWCVFEPDPAEPEGKPLLAKFAWRAPHGTHLLFTHRDGSIAVIHTPESLARAFHANRARVAVEAVPLFERAMERMLEADAAA